MRIFKDFSGLRKRKCGFSRIFQGFSRIFSIPEEKMRIFKDFSGLRKRKCGFFRIFFRIPEG